MPAGGGCCTCSPVTTSAREGCGRCAAAGQTGPPRAGEDRAAAALDAQHRLHPLPCGVCERRRVPDIVLCRPEEVGLVIRPAGGGPLSDIEYLACADDLPICARLAARLQQRLARRTPARSARSPTARSACRSAR